MTRKRTEFGLTMGAKPTPKQHGGFSKSVLRIKFVGNAEMYDEILLSAISPWEFSKLLEKKRAGILCDPEHWINTAFDMPKLRLGMDRRVKI